jgi:hypothetical protein
MTANNGIIVKISNAGIAYIHFTLPHHITQLTNRNLLSYCTKVIQFGRVSYQYKVGSGCEVMDKYWVNTHKGLKA